MLFAAVNWCFEAARVSGSVGAAWLDSTTAHPAVKRRAPRPVGSNDKGILVTILNSKSVKAGRAQNTANEARGRAAPAALGFGLDAADFLLDREQHVFVEAAGLPFVPQHLGRHRKALVPAKLPGVSGW
jgi:hypothetical protein